MKIPCGRKIMGERKEKRYILLVGALISTVALLLIGCGKSLRQDSVDAPEDRAKSLRTVIFSTNLNGVNSTISYVADSIREELEETEDISLSSYVIEPKLYGDIEYKISTAIDLDMDVLILTGSSVSQHTESFEKLQEAGIKLILVDGDHKESGRCAYVGTDNMEAGRLAADTIVKKISKPHIGILSAPLKDSVKSRTSSRTQRREGFYERIEENSSVQVAFEENCSSDIQQAKEDVRKLVEEYEGLNTLFCLDYSSGIAAAAVVEEMGIQDSMFVICFDMPREVKEEIASGGIDAAIVQDYEECGRICADILRELKEDPDSVTDRIETTVCRLVTIRDLEA